MRNHGINKKNNEVSRREFIKTSAAFSLAALAPVGSYGFAAGSDKIRVGLIGCGGRGTGAMRDCINSSEGIKVVAMGDLFRDRLDASLAELKDSPFADKVKLTKDNCFVGFDAYKDVIASDVDMVILATPPHFRPEHLKAAIEAGKHVFMEKPAAVDPQGVHSVIASSELAQMKGLAIVAGTQRRHQAHYVEIMKRVHNGEIGEIVGAQCYWIQDGLWIDKAKDNLINKENYGWSDMEYQCRNWLFYTWLSGDHIVEQHVHNIDIVNWAMGTHPVKAMGMGGREVRTEPQYGNIFDHFAVEYEYPNGTRVLSMCRQTEGASSRVSERLVGTMGSTYTSRTKGYTEGKNAFLYEDESPNPYVQEHTDLIASIRKGEPLNEGKQVAESTLTAIMGRMSAYTGRELTWEWVMNASKLDLSPQKYEFGELPMQAVAVPGKTMLI